MPGEQIRQTEMAEKCGISRVPIREALNTLALQGMLCHKPNSGYFVAKHGPDELAQVRRMLSMLVPEAMSNSRWPTDIELRTLRTLNRVRASSLTVGKGTYS